MASRTSTTLLGGLRDLRNAEVWRAFVKLYRPLVFNYARRRGLQEADADDVAQEVLTALVVDDPIGTLDADKGGFRGWLHGIAQNKIADTYRRRKKSPVQPPVSSQTGFLEKIPDPTDDLDELWTQEFNRFVIQQGLAIVVMEFGARDIEIFERTALQEESPADVADSLGMTREAVYTVKSRVLSRFREVKKELKWES